MSLPIRGPAERVDVHGLPAVRWRSPDGACAIATLQGAQVLSWTPARGEEALYLSERARFEAGRPIRGGIPVAFPQFADRGPLAQHGFARTQPWTLTGAGEGEEGARVTFELEATAATRALWPHAFRLALAATIGGPRLEVELRVWNPGDASFAFSSALHTYLRVADAAGARLAGLRGARFVERGSSAVGVEAREEVTAADPVDRIYFATPAATRLDDGARTFEIEQRGFFDTVVWNPGREVTAGMADMPADGYRRMLCVEAAAVEPQVVLAPGGAWTGGQRITVAATR